MNATEAKDVWLIDASGDYRWTWGPMTLAQARQHARGEIAIRGAGLVDGARMPAGHVQAAVQSGRIRPVDSGVVLI